MYLQCPENTIGSGRDGLLAEEDISKGSSKLDDEEFHRIWEEKRVKLETDHKLESAFIRSIYGQGLVRMEKIKLLDNNFAKKMEEHHLLKYAQLKVREAEQLAAINEERHKAAHWLAKAKACSREPSAVNGPPLGSQSEDDVGGHQPSTLTKTTGPGNVQPMLGQHVEDRNPSERFCPEENNVAPSITSTSTLAEALGCRTPVGNLASVNSQNEVRLMSLERSSGPWLTILISQTNSSDNGKSGLQDVPPPVEHVSDEIQSVDLSGEYQLEVLKTVPSEVVEHVHPVELSNAFKNEPDKGRKIALADDSVGQKDGPDGAVSEGLQNSGELLVHSEQTVVVPDCDHLLPQQVQEDKMDQSLASAEMQDLDAPAGENGSTLQIEVEASELVDTVTPVEASELIYTVTPLPSNPEAPLYLFAAISLQPLRTMIKEYLHETVEPGGIEVLSHNSISQSGENLEIHDNRLDIRPVTSVARGQSVEVSPTPQNDVAIPQAVATTAEQLNQGVLPLGMDSVRFHVPSYHHAHPTHQPTSWNATPCLLTDPLQNELERMRKETELLEKNHEDKTSQLKSDCEKEIQEMITQIRKKYEVKLQESEAAFRLKRNELDKNQTKVLMNKILAEAFRSKCLDVRPPGLPGMQQ
ncbi:hypothetical protein Sango_0592400, partial [Sesamum angolense]